MHHVDRLPYVLYGMYHQHITDILAWLDNKWITFKWLC